MIPPIPVMSLSATAVQPGRCGPDFNDRSPYRRDAHSVQVARFPILQQKSRWAGPEPPVPSERVPRPRAARRGRDGLPGKSRARGGEVLRFRNPCTSSPPPFRGCAGLYTPPCIPRTPPPRQLSRGFTPAYAIRQPRSTILNEARKPCTHGKSTYKHGTLHVRVNLPYTRLRRQTTAP